MKESGKPKALSWRTWLAGVLTGIVNGMFGAGGGLIAIVTLKRICSLDEHSAHAATIGLILPLSVVSVAVYFAGSVIDLNAALLVALGALPGGAAGAWLLGKLRAVWVNRILCLFMFAAALRMLWN
jgi:uncharacterized membrane protein YfcA